jgi:putative transposase
MGKIQNEWHDRNYVLRWFGKKHGEAKKTYCSSYVKKGIYQGRRPERVGGGLIRSLGVWSAVKIIGSAVE